MFLLPYYRIEGELSYDPQKGVFIGCDKTSVQLTYSYSANVQWYNGDYPIAGANNALYSPIKSGEYWACGAPETCPNYISCDSAFGPTIFFNKVIPVIVEKGDSLIVTKGNGHQQKYIQYRWLYNGKIIPGATGAAILPAKAGAYRVSVQDEFACNGISTVFQYYQSLHEVQIKITPNPASDLVQISWRGIDENFRIRIVDAFGKSWYDKQMGSYIFCNIHIQKWPSGSYYVNITDGKNNILHGQFMVQ